MADEKPIIVLKKKGGHGGHHGGAWKVAYADFVTAMMCFFMVMWLINSADSDTKKNIALYFKRPGIFEIGSGAPLLMGEAGILQGGLPHYTKSNEKFYAGAGHSPMKKRTAVDEKTESQEIESQMEEGEDMVPGAENARGLGQGKGPGEGGSNAMNTDLGIEAAESEGPAPEVFKGLSGGHGKMPGIGAGKRAGVGEGQGQKTLEAAQKTDAQNETENPEGKLAGSGNLSAEEIAKAQAEKVAGEIRKQIASSPELEKLLGDIEVKTEADGVHIEIMDTEQVSMFASGSARINPNATAAFQSIGKILGTIPNGIDIVGHTDAKPFSNSFSRGYSNWELSSDRANAARRMLETAGVPREKFENVLGRADKEPRNAADPMAASNRRITLTVKLPVAGKIDLGKDPEALNRILSSSPPQAAQSAKEFRKPEENKSEQPAAVTASSSSSVAPEEALPELRKYKPATAKDVLKRSKKQASKTVPLPGEKQDEPPTPYELKKDKIFSDSPLFGPSAYLLP